METDLQTAIQSVLSNPEQMQSIQTLAKQFMGNENQEKGMDNGFLNGLKNSIAGSDNNESEHLLRAMVPYMRPERRSKVERALKISKIVKVAKVAMEQFGGDIDGI